MDTTETLLSLDDDALVERVVALGGKRFHAKVARDAVLRAGVLDYGAMTSLPAAVREGLAASLPILGSRLETTSVARDGTTKLLLALPRGAARDGADGTELTVETVHIPPHRPLDEDGNVRGATLCVSSQAGCPVGCPFCASGLLGLARNLEAHEIVEQFVRGRAVGPLRRAVVMGIGEPLLNAKNLVAALDVVRTSFGLGARKITVSTVGFPDRLRRLADDRPGFQLAVSLHTPDQDQRDELVPAMAGVPIEDVLAAGDAWFESTGREITYEYVLLGGTNDTDGHADRLVRRLARRRCTVNLIPYNPSPEMPYDRPAADAAQRFR
ncbi:MAG: 23S rRNA (adenine(2503)-C(2))-methyltransferase RlmN, partial [Planctomycetota bacterium]